MGDGDGKGKDGEWLGEGLAGDVFGDGEIIGNGLGETRDVGVAIGVEIFVGLGLGFGDGEGEGTLIKDCLLALASIESIFNQTKPQVSISPNKTNNLIINNFDINFYFLNNPPHSTTVNP